MIDLASLALTPSIEVVSDPAQIADGGGVYGIFFDSGQLLLEKAGYLEFDGGFPYSRDGYDLLYVGATGGTLRHRAIQHLVGNSRTSSLRMTVGAILADELILDPVADGSHCYFDFGDGEARLSAWLTSYTKVAVVPCDAPFVEELALLRTVPLPLNISERKRHRFSKYLMTLRAYYAGRPNKRLLRVPATTHLRSSGGASKP